MLNGRVSIPLVEPGDTVWWHPGVVHAMDDLTDLGRA
jgi:quercetin dioxygenase-like cupin family protein